MEIGKSINKISNRLRRRSKNVQQALGITNAQGGILDFILVEGCDRAVYQKDIEHEFGLRSSTATELLRSLEEKKLICRISDEIDGRRKKIQFTEKASNIKKELQKELQNTESILISGISEKELEQFYKTAQKMLANLSADN